MAQVWGVAEVREAAAIVVEHELRWRHADDLMVQVWLERRAA